MTDVEIRQGLLRREPTALDALLAAYATPVYCLVHRILAGVGTEMDVEECVSDAFHAAWQRIERYDAGRAPLRTWLLNLAKYQALDRRRTLVQRTERAVKETAISQPTPEEAMAGQEDRQAVQRALDQLPRLDRELIYRRYFLEQRVEDAAEALKLSRQSADNRLWRARKALRDLLAIPVVRR